MGTLRLRDGAKGEVVRVALVGKYTKHGGDFHKDVYISVIEALTHASSFLKQPLKIIPIDSTQVEQQGTKIISAANPHAIVVPQGWGSRGVEGKIAAAGYARENKIPYLGLCFGMQLATIEFCRNGVGLKNSNSQEIDPQSKDPVIHIMPEQKEYLAKHQYGGTIRLGAWPCKVKPGTLLHQLYTTFGNGENMMRKNMLSERHRHRYEVNNAYVKRMEDLGMVISGRSPDEKLVEAMELPSNQHPFFLGTQFHPEFRSRPNHPHPLFRGFIAEAKKVIRVGEQTPLPISLE